MLGDGYSRVPPAQENNASSSRGSDHPNFQGYASTFVRPPACFVCSERLTTSIIARTF
jgi:hypothetical protein